MVSRRRSKEGRRHWLGCQRWRACSRVCEWTTCAHAHAGARVCMPKGDPRRRAPGGMEKATTRPCAPSIEDSMVKGGDLVGFLGVARTTVKHQSGGVAFRLPACSHRRISAPGCARVWLRAPKGEGLPPCVCACASQRLDLDGKLGDDACKAHDDTSTRRAHDSKTRKELRFSWVWRAKGKTFRLPTRACTRVQAGGLTATATQAGRHTCNTLIL
jgi:hypothetical protein